MNIILFSRRDGSQEVEKTTEVIVTEEKTPASPASHGKVVSIEQHPDNQNLLLVGFADGQIVLYDLEAKMIQRRFDHSGQVLDWVSNFFDVRFCDRIFIPVLSS